jgi:hypothetical protein
MTTVAVSMVRDEADIVGTTVAHMLTQVDAVIVADNLSSDRTRWILDELAAGSDGRLTVRFDADPAYTQSAKMTNLAHEAARIYGADWIVPFDADEVWYSPHGTLTEILEAVPPLWHVVPAVLWDHVATGVDPDHPDPVVRLGYHRREPGPMPKVAARYHPDLVIEQGNHGAHYTIQPARYLGAELVIRHFPYRSVEQFVRKVRNGAAAYRAAGDSQPMDAGAHWRQRGDLLDGSGEEAVADIFRRWYWRADPDEFVKIEGEEQRPLMYDPAPLEP